VFSIGVENLSRSDITVNPFDVTLVMKDGSSYEYSSETYSYWDRPFSGLTLAPGDQSSGGLVFYVPKSDSPAKIIYRGGWFEENLIIQIKP
jgi:hypothetical protein